MKTVLFIYNFPHKKTQEFLLRMNLAGMGPALVLASPPITLNLPKAFLRDKYRHIDLIDPKEACSRLGVEYIEVAHNSEKVPAIIKEHDIELGVIAGARILKQHVIRAVPRSIINFHPGLIPDNRGLNAGKWAVKLDIPQAVAVHVIDEKIDMGGVLGNYIVPVYSYDTLPEINLRITELQNHLLVSTLTLFREGRENAREVTFEGGYHLPADEEVDREVVRCWGAYIKKWAVDKNGWRCKCSAFLEAALQGVLSCGVCGSRYILRKAASIEYLELMGE